MNNVAYIRKTLGTKLLNNEIITDKTGVKTVEIIGSSFLADEPSILGTVNEDYINRELNWYNSQSRFVKDIPGNTPKIWEQVASSKGMINSNYGWCIDSLENCEQFSNTVQALVKEPLTRRAIMIYTRPSMQYDYCTDGMSDFICTNTVQYFLRPTLSGYKLDVVVNMRSNDVWAGYRNDYAWQKVVQNRVIELLRYKNVKNVVSGSIIWQVGSLHLYEQQFYLLYNWLKTGKTSITKEEYQKVDSI